MAFGVLLTSAAVAYPGGTWHEPGRVGFSFWNNFWCDLLSSRALNGEANALGAALARAAFALFAYALHRFWPLAVARAHASGAALHATPIGRFGAGCLLAVALVPAASSQVVHGVAVVVSAGTSLVAIGLLLRGLQRSGQVGALQLGSATILVALLCLGQYVHQGCCGGRDASWLAGMQKITTIFLLAFMVRLLRGAAPSP